MEDSCGQDALRAHSRELLAWLGTQGLPTEGLIVGGRMERSPGHWSSPTCLGTKSLCMAGWSLTSEAPFWNSLELRGNNRSHQAPPPTWGMHCCGHRVGCTQSSPSWPLAHLPKLPLGTGFGHRIREMGQWLDLGEQTW